MLKIQSLEQIAPLTIVEKIRTNPNAVINDRLSNIHMVDYYIPFSIFELNIENSVAYICALYNILQEVVQATNLAITPGCVKLVPQLSGNGFRLIFGINDEKWQEITNRIHSYYSQQLQNFPFPKPYVVTHKTGNSAATFVHDEFQYISSHPYFVPRAANEEKEVSKTDGPDTTPETGPKEYFEIGTDNPDEDFQLLHNSIPASVPPLPWIPKKVDMKPKIIVVEEMDLNDISEIFLLRSRLAFLETQKGIVREPPTEKEVESAEQQE
jgi:hypothetical protein